MVMPGLGASNGPSEDLGSVIEVAVIVLLALVVLVGKSLREVIVLLPAELVTTGVLVRLPGTRFEFVL